METEPQYHRVLLKLSGETLCSPGGSGVDPAAAAIVADEIAHMNSPGIAVAHVEGECYSLLEHWKGAACVYVIDAARGSKPGVIHRFDAVEETLPVDL